MIRINWACELAPTVVRNSAIYDEVYKYKNEFFLQAIQSNVCLTDTFPGKPCISLGEMALCKRSLLEMQCPQITHVFGQFIYLSGGVL